MSNNFDSAVGAALEIPPQALKAIDDADKKIRALAETSEKAAKDIARSFSITAVGGLEKFIKKVTDTQTALEKLGGSNIQFNINTNVAQQNLDQLTSQTKKTGQDISKTAQDIASQMQRASGSFNEDMSIDKLNELKKAITDVRNALSGSEMGTSGALGGQALSRQELTDKLKLIEEIIAKIKESSAEKEKAAKKEADKTILLEQKNLLAQRLEIQKQINAEELRQQRSKDLGKVISQDDINKLNDYKQRLDALNLSYDELKKRTSELSEKGLSKFNAADIKNELALNKELTASQERLNQAKQQAITQLDETKLKSPGISSREEARYQAQLVGVYNQMIQIIKMKGDMEAKIAAQGGTATQAQANYLKTLETEYNRLDASLTKVSGKFIEIDRVAQSNFANAKTLQLADNAVKLEEAENKAAQAVQKRNQAYHDTSAISAKLDELNQKILQEVQTLQQVKDKATQAQQAMQNWMNLNPTFNFQDATARLDELRNKIQQLRDEASKKGPTKASMILDSAQFKALEQEYNNLHSKISNYLVAVDRVDIANNNASIAMQAYSQRMQSLGDSANKLENELSRVVTANASLNAEMQKGNSPAALAKEYKDLTKRLQEVNQAMTDFRSKGGDIKSPSYQALEQEYLNILSRRKEIEKMDIAEVNQYRQQMAQQAYQADLSAFVQNEADKKAKAIQTATEIGKQYAQSFQGAMTQFNKLMDDNVTSSKFVMNLENVKRVLDDLKAASGKLNILDPKDAQKAEQLKSAIAELTKIYNKYKSNATAPPSVINPQDAIKAAQQAQSLHQLEQAYKQLKEAMSHLQSSDPVWQHMNQLMQQTKQKIDETKRKMGEFNGEVDKTSRLLDGLKGKIAAAFSVAAVAGFLRKMVDIRAQFELQRVALGAIIQDTDEANKTFVKIQNMALESPFTIMQLERATKQIAAFGFETKKLVPTMKMFADISAGLGVEIDRLVLVMGHLKARNFLEGTMVRQFTNMGFNVLGELAKYYSELEDKMVSVGEVQDRVKKKMVSFEDVEEVLKRVTSAGGMFYDMQKKQSDSIWGQQQRIKDATDLMLNEIGQSNEGLIKWVLSTIRQLINSWRTLAPIIKTAAAAMGAYFTTAMLMKGIPMLITNITTGFRALISTTVAAKAASDGLNASMMANPYAAVIAVLAGLAMAIYEVCTAQDRLHESIDRVTQEGYGNMYGLITQYRQLADTVRDSTKPYEERKKALEELHRVYGDILPAEMLEISNIYKMKEGYEEATEAIKAYSIEKTKANVKSEIENEFGKELTEAVNFNAKEFADNVIGGLNEIPMYAEMTKQQLQGVVKGIMTGIVEEVKAGTLSVKDMNNEFKKQFIKMFNISDADYKKISDKLVWGLDSAFKSAFSKEIGLFHSMFGVDWFDSDGVETVINELQATMGDLDSMFENPQKEYFQDEIDKVTELRNAVQGYIEQLQNLKDANFDAMGGMFGEDNGLLQAPTPNIMDTSAIDNFNSALETLYAALKNSGIEDFNVSLEDLQKYLLSDADGLEYTSDVINNTILRVIDELLKKTKNPFFQNWLKNVRTEIEKTKLTSIQHDVIKTERQIAKSMGVSMTVFKKLKIEGINSFSDVRDKAKKLTDECDNSISRIKAMIVQLIKLKYTAAQAKAIAEEREGAGTLEELEKERKAFDSLARSYGHYDKEKKKAEKKSKKSGKQEDKELKKYQELKKVLEEVRTEYDKLRKSYDVETSNKKIGELYGKVFEEQGAKISDFYQEGTYEAEQLIKALRVLQGLVNPSTDDRKKFRSEIERSIDKTQVEIDLKLAKESEDKFKKDIANLFDNYALTKELKDVGLNVDLTYMVGGKPTTLEDVRRQLDEWLEEKKGTAAGEEYIKQYEAAQKKITDIETKEAKERLKKYEKYLKAMYSERAKKMIESYTKMELMEKDFQSYIQRLQEEMEAPDTTEERKRELANLIKSLKEQAKEGAIGLRRELDNELSKLDWNQFKGSPVFTEMFQDLEGMGKKGLDALTNKLTEVRSKLQAMDNVDFKAVREVTKYIDQLDKAKINLQPYTELKKAMKEVNALRKKGIDYSQAQINLIEAQNKLDASEREVSDLETIVQLKNQKVDLDKDSNLLTTEQYELYQKYKNTLSQTLKDTRERVKKEQEAVDAAEQNVDAYRRAKMALEAHIQKLEELKGYVSEIVNSVFEMADALGGVVDDEWKNLTNTIADSTFQVLILIEKLKLMDLTLKSTAGVIGLISIGLQVLASLFTAIFAARDKHLQKQIEKLQDEVDRLDKAFQKLQTSIEKAFNIKSENRLTQDAINNLNKQKEAYEQMIRLEEAKKKTDNDKIKEYKEKIEDLNDTLEELYETRREKWGSTNDAWSEANNWVDAWLDAFKETGDGLDTLNESWDNFYENLVKKQATSKVLGERMNKWLSDINDILDKSIDGSMSEYDLIDQYKQIGEKIKSELGAVNQGLLDIFNYAGIGGKGEYLLSDLQKGIQNITEPQAAAIEAYLNSMRFAVFRQVEQLDILITTIQAQYGGGESPMLQEVRLIRSVVETINTQLGRVIVSKNANTNYVLKVDMM